MSDDVIPRPLRRNWFHILLALSSGPLHGYGIMKAVEDHSDGEVKLWPATLYGTLREMRDAGLIEELPEEETPDRDGRERRTYRMTEAGRDTLATEADRLEGLVELARAGEGRAS